MSDAQPTTQRSFWSRVGAVFDMIRTIVGNLLLVALLVILGIMLFSGPDRPTVPEGGALVLNPEGVIVEELSATGSLQDLVSMGQATGEVRLQDVLGAIKTAAADDRIQLLVLDLDDLLAVNGAQRNAIGRALTAFKETGKPVWSIGNFYAQEQYYLASFADAVYMHPMGQVLLTGFGNYQPFISPLLDKARVNVHVFRVGTYKSAVEPYTRPDMSPASKEANQALMDGLWGHYRSTVAANRQLEADQIQNYADGYDTILAEAQGDMARVALEQRLVDELLTQDQMFARISDLVGADDEGEFQGIGLHDYVGATTEPVLPNGNQKVAVIRAEGTILMGDQPRRTIGAQTLTELIQLARKDDTIKSVVLRVDSPGGSAFASEVIRQELELLQISGKPLVVSMGGAAASGGYWISATADRIFASPATITGSIGIFGIVPSFENALSEVGVQFDGVGTTELSDGLNPASGISEKYGRIFQSNVENGYQRFIHLVARGRDMAPDAVDSIAQGRVWLGSKALELGLVDELGGLADAIESAAALAGMEDYDVINVEQPLSARDQLIRQLTQNLGLASTRDAAIRSELGPLVKMLSGAFGASLHAVNTLARLNDPANTYALCEACRF